MIDQLKIIVCSYHLSLVSYSAQKFNVILNFCIMLLFFLQFSDTIFVTKHALRASPLAHYATCFGWRLGKRILHRFSKMTVSYGISSISLGNGLHSCFEWSNTQKWMWVHQISARYRIFKRHTRKQKDCSLLAICICQQKDCGLLAICICGYSHTCCSWFAVRTNRPFCELYTIFQCLNV